MSVPVPGTRILVFAVGKAEQFDSLQQFDQFARIAIKMRVDLVTLILRLMDDVRGDLIAEAELGIALRQHGALEQAAGLQNPADFGKRLGKETDGRTSARFRIGAAGKKNRY